LLASAAVDLEAFAGGQTALTDNRVLVSVEGLGIVPNTDDKLLLDATEYRTEKVTRLAPAGEVIFYEMQVHSNA
ncbi:MAG: hypothetical protein WBA35_07575, partial [Litorimonas sp.]